MRLWLVKDEQCVVVPDHGEKTEYQSLLMFAIGQRNVIDYICICKFGFRVKANFLETKDQILLLRLREAGCESPLLHRLIHLHASCTRYRKVVEKRKLVERPVQV